MDGRRAIALPTVNSNKRACCVYPPRG
jgi:hypothetical protein